MKNSSIIGILFLLIADKLEKIWIKDILCFSFSMFARYKIDERLKIAKFTDTYILYYL